MTMLITTLGFVILTWVFIRRHMHRTQGDAKTTLCPRCHTAVPNGAARCRKCGVPLQLFEVVMAKEATEEPDAATGEAPHAVVRADVCVGCGSCVPACPEPGAIKLLGKLATVNVTLCKGHGKCVEACPVGGIVLATSNAVHRVEVPQVDVDFESNVRGIYIVGELGGRGLIKNAINEARIAVDHIADELGQSKARPDAGDDVFDVVIVGSGPAGLSAGLESKRHGLRYVMLEQGSLADTIRKYPRAKVLLAEPVRVPLYGNLWVADGSKDKLLEVWENIVERTGLDVRTFQRVSKIRRENSLLVVDTPDASYRAQRVVLAMGRRGTPRRLGVPGEDLGKVIYDVVDMDSFSGQRMLVVGGGDSAVESAVGLARQQGTTVTLSYRGSEFARVKERNRTKLQETVHCGKLRVVLNSEVREIRDAEVLLDVEGRQETLPNDTVVVRIGGDPPYKFLEQIGVRIVKKDVPLRQEEESVIA